MTTMTQTMAALTSAIVADDILTAIVLDGDRDHLGNLGYLAAEADQFEDTGTFSSEQAELALGAATSIAARLDGAAQALGVINHPAAQVVRNLRGDFAYVLGEFERMTHRHCTDEMRARAMRGQQMDA